MGELTEPVTGEESSLTVQLSERLLKHIQRAAKTEGVTLDQWVTRALQIAAIEASMG